MDGAIEDDSLRVPVDKRPPRRSRPGHQSPRTALLGTRCRGRIARFKMLVSDYTSLQPISHLSPRGDDTESSIVAGDHYGSE